MTAFEAQVRAEALLKDACANGGSHGVENGAIKKPVKSDIMTETLNTFQCAGVTMLSVVDDPKAERPFRVGCEQRTTEQAAVIAFGILAHLRQEGKMDVETDVAFDEVMQYLSIRSVKGQIPF